MPHSTRWPPASTFVEAFSRAGALGYRARSRAGWIGPDRTTYSQALADAHRYVGVENALRTMPREKVATRGVQLVEELEVVS
jgi:hypothetical protein